MRTLNHREFAMIEVWRQGYWPKEYTYNLRVNGMADALRWATRRAKWVGHEKPTIDDMLFVAGEIEPVNRNGFRRVGVIVGGYVAPHWGHVPGRIHRLWEFINDATPEEFYKEFEEIHPFEDGNGRTGKVLYNWLKGTLDEPEFPPNFFGGDVP